MACSESNRPSPLQGQVDSGPDDVHLEPMDAGPPPPDASGYCGNDFLPVVGERPNLFFIVDASGSMEDALEGTATSKYEAARTAVAELLTMIGHRVDYGAAVFPGDTSDNLCSQGRQIFKTRSGDPPEFGARGERGPILGALVRALNRVTPLGGTPISATLGSLRSKLRSLEGETFVVLATDGAPNCNDEASCSAQDCELTDSGVMTVNGKLCSQETNCCDPDVAGQEGVQLSCIDSEPTRQAVIALAASGIRTFVIGMPGSERYADELDALAIAGGTARTSSPRYYAADDVASLSGALRDIGGQVSVSCTIELSEEPPAPDLVNVYFDAELVAQDPEDGWDWIDSATIELNGQSCKTLTSGFVLNLQIVAGCPTIIR